MDEILVYGTMTPRGQKLHLPHPDMETMCACGLVVGPEWPEDEAWSFWAIQRDKLDEALCKTCIWAPAITGVSCNLRELTQNSEKQKELDHLREQINRAMERNDFDLASNLEFEYRRLVAIAVSEKRWDWPHTEEI